MDRRRRCPKEEDVRVLLCLLFINIIVNTSEACPSICRCGTTNRLVAVNCESKSLREFPVNISRDTQLLRFRGNDIIRLPSNFPTLWPNTATLSIENNKIQRLPDGIFANLKNLQEIFMSNNRIQSVGKRLFANTGTSLGIRFYLENNLLEDVAEGVFENCTSTVTVHWNLNRIKVLRPGVFARAEGISYLNLEDNMIENLSAGAFKDLSKLYYLGLGSNHLSILPSGVFQGLHRVETLTLQKNKLSSLPSDVFKDLSVVKEINLESNLFSEPPVDVIRSLPSFTKIKLKSNPIKCTCKLKSDLADEAIRSIISDLDVTRCVNMNKTMLEAITAVNCVTEPTPTTPVQPTTAKTGDSTKRKNSNELLDRTSAKIPSTTEKVYTNVYPARDDYENKTPLPLIIGVAIGGVILVVVIVLFVYLYRRPIVRRASTMSLPRKKKTEKSNASKDIHYKKSPFNDYSTDYNI
ncbi:chondroadherin-like [Rhopilema esculentum]|uniref:chondroadherin-like n=1 Tax=Rhopilema esculentum TaxID=499914 RepID=UPI0031E4291D